MEKLVYQMFVLGSGDYLNIALQKGLGGVIFFTRDINTKEEFIDFIAKIKQKAVIPPFLSIDQEGGKVERTENIHSRYVSPKYAYEKGEKFLKEQTHKIAEELKDYGINLNFAPCADVNTNPNNPIIGERAFSNNTDDVINGVNIVSEIYKQYGIIPCIKHFPGHGNAEKDSHLTLPQINLSLNEMEENHIRAFKEANNPEMIMVAHLHCTCFDEKIIPSSLSKNVIGYLRNRLNYNGIIISDDMVMKAVQDYGSLEACKMAILAGVDMFIFRDADKLAYETIEALILEAETNKELNSRIMEANARIQQLKKQRLR